MSESRIKIVILASGRGSNAKVLMEFARSNPDLVRVVGLISDRDGVGVLALAKSFSVPAFVVDHRKEEELVALLEKLSPNWACLAGYKRKVGARFLRYFADNERGYFRVMNVHPSLLPAYPGLNGYERAWKDKRNETGVTVHLVDEGLDTGAPILQEAFAILPEDSVAEVEARGLSVEHRLFPQALKLAALGQIKNTAGGQK